MTISLIVGWHNIAVTKVASNIIKREKERKRERETGTKKDKDRIERYFVVCDGTRLFFQKLFSQIFNQNRQLNGLESH